MGAIPRIVLRRRLPTAGEDIPLSPAVRIARSIAMLRTTYTSQKILNNGYRNTAWTPPATVYASLLTAVTDALAGTVTEASYAGYARAAITFGAPAAGPAAAGQKIQNTGLVSFGQKTDAGSVTFIAVGIWDASSSGNLLDVCFNDGADPFGFIGVDTSTSWLTANAHGLGSNQRVRLQQVDPLNPLPSPLALNTDYFVITNTADLFGLSASAGPGAQVTITVKGKGNLYRVTPVTVNQNDTPQIAISALTVYDA